MVTIAMINIVPKHIQCDIFPLYFSLNIFKSTSVFI